MMDSGGLIMCDIVGQVIDQAIARRRLLGGVGAGALAAVFGTPASAAEIAQQQERIAQAESAADSFGIRLALLGTAGGPTWWTNTSRRSVASALVVGDAIYMVDCGDGAGKRLQEALDPPSNRTLLRTLRGLFLTHLHSDHTVDYPNLLLYGLYSGLDDAEASLKVFGPGRRGEMEPVFAVPGRQPAAPEIINPGNPTPGTEDMTGYLYQAYATDINDRMRDNGRPDLRSRVHVEDIKLPQIPGFTSPNQTAHPDMEPFAVYQDDRVRVSATLVYHFPIWPAFAFRFDTDDGSVVFSGDTGPSQNLIRLAKGADILVHEVIVSAWVDRVLPEPRSPAQEALREHLLSAHTPVEQVGKVAESAGVSTLVLSHIVPGNARAEELISAQRDFSGQLVIGEDLLQLGVRRSRR
jgi:ribonuclease BN (tRNA processing enzyme)